MEVDLLLFSGPEAGDLAPPLEQSNFWSHCHSCGTWYMEGTGLACLNKSLYLRLLKTPRPTPHGYWGIYMLGRQLVTAWGRALRRRNLAQPPPCSVSMLDACSHPPTHPSQFPLPKFPPRVVRNSHAETAGQRSRAAEGGFAASLPLLPSAPHA